VKYLVTGATGNIGSRIVTRLQGLGFLPRIFVRDASKARARFGDGADIYVGDFGDASALAAALGGVDRMFLVTSGDKLAAQDEAVAKAAKAAGVGLIVKLSSYDARNKIGTGIWHAEGEANIRSMAIPSTFIQPTGFMDNALYWASSIKSEGIVRSATGEGKIPFVHSDDIAEVATLALTTNRHVGDSIPLTGPEALSYAEMAIIIGEAIGRPLQYQSVSDATARQQQISLGAPALMIEARLSIFRAIREGHLAAVTDGIEWVAGRRPKDFRQWAIENKGAFV
jgi:(4-alkanoyl-5-oxo-2,5-dihydrofuran-3-yl)methyl phosphate reductase